jgi:hypothetical protein
MIAVVSDSHQFRSCILPIAVFNFQAAEAEMRFGFVFTRYQEDGLGDALGKIVRVDSGRHFMLKERLDSRTPSVFAEADDQDRTPEGLHELLKCLGVRREECVWTIEDALGKLV